MFLLLDQLIIHRSVLLTFWEREHVCLLNVVDFLVLRILGNVMMMVMIVVMESVAQVILIVQSRVDWICMNGRIMHR